MCVGVCISWSWNSDDYYLLVIIIEFKILKLYRGNPAWKKNRWPSKCSHWNGSNMQSCEHQLLPQQPIPHPNIHMTPVKYRALCKVNQITCCNSVTTHTYAGTGCPHRLCYIWDTLILQKVKQVYTNPAHFVTIPGTFKRICPYPNRQNKTPVFASKMFIPLI